MAVGYHGCAQGTIQHDFIGEVSLAMCASDDYYSVYASMEMSDKVVSFDPYYDWEMELQRYDYGWKTIDTRTGYITSHSPSNRTFSNVLVTGGNLMRFVTRFYYRDGEYITTRVSPDWVR